MWNLEVGTITNALAKSIFSAILLNVLLVSGSLASVYYVDQSAGLDSNDGRTTSTAWRSLEKVSRSRFLPGDEIRLKRGERWDGELTLSSSGRRGQPIVIAPYGEGAAPVIDGGERRRFGVSGSGVHHVVIRGLELIGWRDAGVFNQGGHAWTIEENTIANGGDDSGPDHGIRVSAHPAGPLLSEIVIRGNTIGRINRREDDSVTSTGILVQGVNTAVIRGNEVHTENTAGIRSILNTGSPDNIGVTIESNRVVGSMGGILVHNTDGARILRNVIQDGKGLGIGVAYSSDDATLAYNLIQGLRTPSEHLWNGIDINHASGNGRAFKNTVYGVNRHCFLLDDATGTSDGWEITQNIFDASANSGNMLPMGIQGSPERPIRYRSDYNLLLPRQTRGPDLASRLPFELPGGGSTSITVRLDPRSPYTISSRARSGGAGLAKVVIQANNRGPLSPPYLLAPLERPNPRVELPALTIELSDREWVRREAIFMSEDATAYTITVQNAGRGTVWFDDFQVFSPAGIVANWNGKALNLEAYRAQSSQGAHSLQADPRFVDPASGNFLLQSTSPAIRASEGRERPRTGESEPDRSQEPLSIGAFEAEAR